VVDKNVVLSRVSQIRESVQRLVALAALSEKAFRADKDACAIAERHLQVAIQSVIDIGNHVVADLDLGTPSDYKEIFVLLARHRLVSKPLAKRLGAMAGMRNVLVHDYMKVDLGLVYHTLTRDLGDFERFITAVLALV
jgi:uncharacterized protein YutE (UPF0331/DUF86 family)